MSVDSPNFSDTLFLKRHSSKAWDGEVDPRYANDFGGVLIGQFGGWTAAMLLKAALGDAQPGQFPRSLSVHFLSAIEPGAFLIRTSCLRQGRTVAFWQADLLQGEAVRATAIVIVGATRADASSHAFAMIPKAQDPETPGLPRFGPPTPFAQMLESRWIEGVPFQNTEIPARSLLWMRTVPPTKLDAAALTLCADFIPPRIFYVTGAFVPTTTLSLSIYFYGTPEETEAVGDGYVLAEIKGRRASGGFWEHTASLWSAEGALLASTEQHSVHRG
jgi:acyl-CoA thioesterase